MVCVLYTPVDQEYHRSMSKDPPLKFGWKTETVALKSAV
jgi:hypothetical protein